MTFEYSVNYLAVIIATLVSFFIGFLWYGPIFGKIWMKLNNIKSKDVKKAKENGMLKPMIINFIGTLITAFVIASLIATLNLTTLNAAITLSFLLWIGFIASTTLLGSVLWDNKPWGLFILNGAYWLVNLEILSIIISLWA
jgi:E3 ubiquitin-protein ligase DOA10